MNPKSTITNSFLLLFLMTVVSHFAIANQKEIVTLLVLYHPDIADSLTHTQIATEVESRVERVNEIYSDSGVQLYLDVVSVEPSALEYDPPEELLTLLENDSGVKEIRNNLSADFVTYYTNANIKARGRAKKSDDPEVAHSVIRWENCLSSWEGCENAKVLAHELGHSMGLGHSAINYQASEGSRYEYGRGYGVQSKFATIMAHESDYGVSETEPLFSSPNILCPVNGEDVEPCGIAADADAVSALNNSKHILSKYRREIPNPLDVSGTDHYPYVFNASRYITISFPDPDEYTETAKVRIIKDGSIIVDTHVNGSTYRRYYSQGSYQVSVWFCEQVSWGEWCNRKIGEVRLEAQ